PGRLHVAGFQRHGAAMVQRSTVAALVSGRGRGARATGDRRPRRRVHRYRRRAVPRLARGRQLPHLPLRRAGAVGRHDVPEQRRACAAGILIRWLRRDGHGDAAARTLRGVRDTRRRHAVRKQLPARVHRRHTRVARFVRRLLRTFLGGLPLRPARVLEEVRPHARQRLGDGGGVLRWRAAVRCRDRRTARRRVGSVAAVGPCAHGSRGAVRRRPARDARDLDRRGPQRRVPPRPRRDRLSPRDRGCRRRRERPQLRAPRRRSLQQRLAPPAGADVPRRAARGVRPPLDVVTGAYGYTGRYLTQRLLQVGRSVRTLTANPSRPDLFGGRVEAQPFSFDDPGRPADALREADTLYNTYWVRFPYRDVGYERAVENTRVLFTAAREAGVQRIAHVSGTKADEGSP